MCGIMGYYSFGKELPDKNKLSKMFSLLETRGRDASGFAYINEDGNLNIHKAPIKASEMIKTEEWKKLLLPKSMIMHCRMKTQGSEKNNMNNHPLFNKLGIAIVHNGIIHNDEEIIGKKQRDGEVDSEAILQLLSLKYKGDKIKRLFDKIEGSFAVAILNSSERDKLILIKKDNPIDLYFDSESEIFYFCSERYIMQEALGIKGMTKMGFNIGESNYHFYEMNNNHSLIINKDGVEAYQRYVPRGNWYDRRFYNYESERDKVECPWCFSQTKYDCEKQSNRCEVCGVEIDEEDLYNVI